MRTWTSARTVVVLVALLVGLTSMPASTGPSAEAAGQVSAYFFGDSLMNGTGASPRRPVMARVAAARLGWDVEVDAWGGTGYTTTGRSPGYLQRLKRPGAMTGEYDVVLLEGGTNDARVKSTPAQVQAAVREVVAHVRERQPQAAIVLMGAYDPPPPGRVDPHRTTVDDAIGEVADELGLPFFSPLSGDWTVGQRRFLHPDRLHPNERGYGVMGARLAEELERLDLG
ncbi:MAG: SGNH/GDSL hydrolase family protein [Frankiales bacterium]|nr:MAG: SGNH/GDSL hydrolase family protein [Frankiales bacterium]